MRTLLLLFLSLGLLQSQTLTLFDGKSLDQWEGNPALWRIEDEAITASIAEGETLSKNEFLYWKGTLTDFDLSLNYRITGGPTANSGIQVRSQKDDSGHAAGYQCDLDDGKVWLGRIYDEHGRALIAERGALTKISPEGKRHAIPFSEPDKLTRFAKVDEWNHYLIRARGPRIEIHINGIHFTTLEDFQRGEADLSGLLAVQLHSGVGPAKIQFRDIILTPFEQKEMTVLDEPTEERSPGIVPADAPNIGFENGNYHGWTQTGKVWSKGPIKGDSIADRKRGASTHDGDYWVGGYEVWLSDEAQGTLLSDPFKVTHPWATYRIGAGPHAETRVEILEAESGEVLHKASGRGQIENMALTVVDLTKHVGKSIRVRVVDEHSGPWGHVNYDDFRFHQTTPNSMANGRLSSSPLLWNLESNPIGEEGDITSRMFVPDGFQVETIAREPQLRQPIAFTFDSRGRIWIAEAFAYPRRRADGEAKDRLIILEDTDHDGTFETHKVFADNLNLISGFEIGYGGVFAACAPEFLFIPDANGDDIPDGPHDVLLDGFSIRDTHETPNSFLWGHDGWLYGCHGVFNPSLVGKPGTAEEERLPMQAAIWRFHPVTHVFEIYSHGGSNQWGLDYGPDGSLFMTHCRSSWGLGPVSQVFQDGHYWTQNNSNHRDFIATDKVGWNRTDTTLFNYFDSIAAYGHGEGGAGAQGSRSIFGGHSHVGTMIYLGDNWPYDYLGDLYTHNLHGQQLNREILAQRDSAYLSSSHGQDIFYTSDKKYLAVDLKYGPDGAVYSIDWQDTQQCHVNDEARWDRTNGRLYRMSWAKTFKPAQFEDLAKASDPELLSYLQHENEWFARMAQHQLRQRAANKTLGFEIIQSLRGSLDDTKTPYRFRHLVALHATGAFSHEDTQRLLQAEDETLRNQALHYLTNEAVESLTSFEATLLDLAKNEPSPRVRLTLAGACQQRLPEKIRVPILLELAKRAEDAYDRFIPKMIWFGLATNASNQPVLLADLALETPLPMLRDSILWHLARQDVSAAIALAIKLSEPSNISLAAAVLSQALRGSEQPAPKLWAEFSAKVGASGDPEAIAHLAELQAVFGLAEAQVTDDDDIPFKGDPIPNARKITIETAKGLKFAQELITAKPGEGLELIFDNKDAIPHNLVLIQPGSFEKVGAASDALISDPNAAEKHYVPDVPEIIDFTPVISGGKAFIIHMRAPNEPGDYPYICTFPGHWRVMKGILRVGEETQANNINTKKVLFLAGRDSHGWGSHQHFGGTNILAEGMRHSGLAVEVQVIRDWPDDILLGQQDALVIYADGWGAHPANGNLDSLKKFMDQGGGLTVIHWATGLGSPEAGDKTRDHSVDPIRRQWRNLVGADFEPWHSVSRFWDASFENLPEHPVTRGVPPFVIHDECYFHLRCTDPEHAHVTPLHGAVPPVNIIHPGRAMDSGSDSAVEAVKRGEEQYCAWGFERPAGGRTFGFTGGHTHWNWGRDELRKLILNGIYWTTGAEVPSQGIGSTRPTATEMLEHLKGNPGWTPEGLQILLDRAGEGELIKWNQFSRGSLSVGPPPEPKPKKDLGPGLVIEGEHLKIVEAEGSARAQAMQGFGQGVWSGNSQLWWVAEKEGATLTLEFSVPETKTYEVHLAGTKAADYGIHALAINGTTIGKPQDFFQARGVSHTNQISIGKVALKKGKNLLMITATGTHPKSVRRYMFGLDFLRLHPEE